jgi:hypothetical protein
VASQAKPFGLIGGWYQEKLSIVIVLANARCDMMMENTLGIFNVHLLSPLSRIDVLVDRSVYRRKHGQCICSGCIVLATA